MRFHRGNYRRAWVIALLGLSAGLLALQGQEKPPAPPQAAKEHGPFKPGDRTIPYLDATRVSQEYKSYPDPKPKVVKAGPVNAATMSRAAEELIVAELADRKCKPHSGACLRAGDKWLCTYQLQYEGIPLAKTTDAMCIIRHDGHALVFRQRNVPRKVNATRATVDRKAAVLVAQKDLKERSRQQRAEASGPFLEIWVDSELHGRLCWTFTVSNGSVVKPQAARYWVAAVGEARVVAVENLIHHVHGGSVTGTVWATTPHQPTQSLPLGYLDVTCGKVRGRPRPTGPGGEYSFIPAGGSTRIRATLAGPACVIENHGEGPVLARARSGDEGGRINLAFDAKAEFEIAQVSAFYWTGVARDFAKDFLLPSHLSRLTTRVNLDDTCNAGFNGADVSINFFRAGNGCLNTAFSDIVLHEYGHAIDFVHGGILDGGYSEGFGDALAILVTRQPLVGRDLNGPGSAIRDARKIVTYPPSRAEPHFVGQIYAGFTWELIQQLRKHYHGDEEAYEVARRLILAADAMNPKDIPDAVRLAFLADDDDGDLTNGSPHFAELAAAADSRKIPRPPDPVTTSGPRHAYIGRRGTHHLAAAAGTGMYFWDSRQRLATLKLDKADADFWHYCETEPPGHRWAFARGANSRGQFAVWFIPADGKEGRRVFFHFARRVTPDSPAERKLNKLATRSAAR